MKRKVLMIVVCFCIAILMTACGDSSSQTTNDTTATETEEQDSFESGKYDFAGDWEIEGAYLEDKYYTMSEIHEMGYYPEADLLIDSNGNYDLEIVTGTDSDESISSSGTYTVYKDTVLLLEDSTTDKILGSCGYVESNDKLLFYAGDPTEADEDYTKNLAFVLGR